MERLKRLFNELEELESITNSLEDDETKEDEWLEAYTKEYNTRNELVAEIIKLTNLYDDTVKRMIATKRDELRSLVSRIA